MAYACIDVGSNTTRLLVAELHEGRLRELAARREFTRIGRSLIDDGVIPRAKLENVCEVISAQAAIARALGAREIAVVGTAAVRRARNGDELAAEVGRRCGLDLRVLSGSEEAALAFSGATRCRGRPPEGRLAVVDAGGWSTEIVLGTLAGGVQWSGSYAVGSGLLADRHLRSDPPSRDELAAVRGEVTAAFEGLDLSGAREAVAVGGSATSLRRLVGRELTAEALEHAIELLSRTPIGEASQRLELHHERVRLMPAAMLILADLTRRLDRPLAVGGGGLREGVILELAEGQGR